MVRADIILSFSWKSKLETFCVGIFTSGLLGTSYEFQLIFQLYLNSWGRPIGYYAMVMITNLLWSLPSLANTAGNRAEMAENKSSIIFQFSVEKSWVESLL